MACGIGAHDAYNGVGSGTVRCPKKLRPHEYFFQCRLTSGDWCGHLHSTFPKVEHQPRSNARKGARNNCTNKQHRRIEEKAETNHVKTQQRKKWRANVAQKDGQTEHMEESQRGRTKYRNKDKQNEGKAVQQPKLTIKDTHRNKEPQKSRQPWQTQDRQAAERNSTLRTNTRSPVMQTEAPSSHATLQQATPAEAGVQNKKAHVKTQRPQNRYGRTILNFANPRQGAWITGATWPESRISGTLLYQHLIKRKSLGTWLLFYSRAKSNVN